MSDNSVDLLCQASTYRYVTDSLHGPDAISVATDRRSSSRTLFAGVNDAACRVLQVPSLRHRSALHELTSRPAISRGVVEAVYAVISDNLRSSRLQGLPAASRENWRWCQPQPQIAKHNSSPEVRLERAIAAACLRAGRSDWANQVPVASGIMGSSADRRRAIDLVHLVAPNHFEFIELKIASDTPLYAAIEIIGYGCAWLLARDQRADEPNALLDADQLDLVVLAPSAYYAPYALAALEAVLDEELCDLGKANGVELGFRFERLPDELMQTNLPADNTLLALLDQRRPLHV